jgi:hypothetical protein
MPNDRTDSPVERAHFPWRLMTLHRNFKWRTSTQKCAHTRAYILWSREPHPDAQAAHSEPDLAYYLVLMRALV